MFFSKDLGANGLSIYSGAISLIWEWFVVGEILCWGGRLASVTSVDLRV